MIVFGHNSFSIHSCKPSQLGLPQELDESFSIELRQRYFHLFWIPFFGIGKIWTLRKFSDNKLYEPNAEMLKFFNSLPIKHRTPWYTFALFFVALGAGAIFLISEAIDDYQSKVRHERYLVEKNERLINAINSPESYYYFEMDTDNGDLFLKVIDSNENSIRCLKSTKDPKSYSKEKVLEAFLIDSVYRSFDTVSIKKADLLETINKKDEYGFKGHEIMANTGLCKLEEMTPFPFPIFKHIGSGYQEGDFIAVVQNIGAPGSCKLVSTESTNISFDDPLLPENLKTGTMAYLIGTYTDAEPQQLSRLVLTNSQHDSVEYRLRINGTYLTFNAVNQ